MVRTELREHIFKMLFQIEFNTLEEMPKHLELYFEELTSAKEKDKEYIQKKLEAVIEKLEEIDAILKENTPSQTAPQSALPKGESLAKPRTLHGLPRPLPLGEVDLQSKDGEGEDVKK